MVRRPPRASWLKKKLLVPATGSFPLWTLLYGTAQINDSRFAGFVTTEVFLFVKVGYDYTY